MREEDFFFRKLEKIDTYVCIYGRQIYVKVEVNSHLVGTVHALHEEHEELGERCLVHAVHATHLHNRKVEHGPSCRDGSELLSLLGDAELRACRSGQLDVHLGGLGLRVGKHADELLVLEQVARVGGQSL
jgi:hypothetical protein